MFWFFDDDTNERELFNCGGYAFDTFDWYRPYSDDFDIDSMFNEENQSEVMEHMVQHMLEDFKGRLRIVESEKEVTRLERLVLFRTRVFPNPDFHFVVRKGRNFFHKRGWKPDFERMKKAEAFGAEWIGCYDSPIVMFAYKVP